MATDNYNHDRGTAVKAADNISSVFYDLVKLGFGALDAVTLVSSANGLPVNVVAGSSGGVTHNDDAAFTVAVDDVVPAAAMFDDTLPDSVDEGDAGVLRMSANRNLYVRIRDDAGNERGLNVDASGRIGVTVETFPDNEPFNVAQMNGVAVTMNNGVAGTGVQRVTIASDSTGNIATIGTSVTPGTGASNLGKAEDAAHTSGDVGVMVLGIRDDTLDVRSGTENDYEPFHMTSTGRLYTSATIDTALPAGTNNIGDVDIVTFPDNEPFNMAQWGGTAVISGGTAGGPAIGGIQAHDAAISGNNPVLIAVASEDLTTSAPGNRVSAEADVTRLAASRDGALYVLPHGPQYWDYHENSSSALTDATVEAAPGVGLSLYVTDIIVSTGAATALNVFFEEGATTVLGPWYLEAVAGRGLHVQFQTPRKITANTALTITTSAAIAHGIDVTGYVAPG